MEKRVFKIMATLLLVFAVTGCKKNKDGQEAAVNYRIVSATGYEANSSQIYAEENYYYSENKLSHYTSTEKGDLYELLFEYPNENKILANQYKDGTFSGTYEYNLSNNKIIELV